MHPVQEAWVAEQVPSVVTASLGKLCQRLPYSNKMPTPMTLQ